VLSKPFMVDHAPNNGQRLTMRPWIEKRLVLAKKRISEPARKYLAMIGDLTGSRRIADRAGDGPSAGHRRLRDAARRAEPFRARLLATAPRFAHGLRPAPAPVTAGGRAGRPAAGPSPSAGACSPPPARPRLRAPSPRAGRPYTSRPSATWPPSTPPLCPPRRSSSTTPGAGGRRTTRERSPGAPARAALPRCAQRTGLSWEKSDPCRGPKLAQ
jgi:hypothetical protein